MSEQNPLSQGYAAISAAFAAWPALTTLVRPGNLSAGNLQTQGFKPKQNIAAADRPEIRVEEKRIQGSPWMDSKNIVIKCLYPISIYSGSMGIDKANLISVLTLQALLNAGIFLGKPDLIIKWDWQDATAVMRDVPAGRPSDWTIVGGVLIQFGLDRNQFVQTSFS